MAEVLNKIADLTVLNDTQIEKQLLKRLLPTLRAYQDGQKTVLKQNAGLNVEWMRFESLANNTTVATEGVTPEAEAITPTPVTTTVNQYVRGIILTDRLMRRGKHRVRAEAIALLSEAGRKTIDSVILAELIKATKEYYGGGKTKSTITATDYISESEIEKAFVYLSNNDVPRFEDGTYHALVTPLQASDIRKLNKFVDKSKYQDPTGKGLLYGEIGMLGGIKFLETTNVPTAKVGASDAVTAHQILVYGPDAYGVVDIEEDNTRGKPSVIWKGLGSAGTTDFANQRASAATKFEFAAKILDEKRICKVIAPVSISI